MINKIQFINDLLYNKKDYYGPPLLYKYRPFDEHTFEMLENKYVYLCQAKKLDDPTECDTSYNMENFYSESDDAVKIECIEQIIEMIKPYCKDDDFEDVRDKILKFRNDNGNISPRQILDYSLDLQNEYPEMNIVNLVNYIVNIPEMLERSQNKKQIDDLLSIGINSKEKFGICSLAESLHNDKMWEEYTNSNSGYCIEYDVSQYEYNKIIFPVIYSDDRNTNIIMQVVSNFIGVVIDNLSNGEVNTDKSQFIRLFLTKNTKWNYQNEWRIVAEADIKLPAPKIKRIILGEKVSENNANLMLNFCAKNNILCVKYKNII